MKLDVPFYLQTKELNCGPVALKMALEFLGEKYSTKDMEKEVEIKEGKAVSTLKLAIAARKLGFKVEFYSKTLGLNKENLKMDFYKQYNDLDESESQKLFNEAREIGVELYEKTLSLEEIINNIREDRIMIVLLDWNVIKGKEGFQGHFVPIVGYDEENFYIHNHGFLNPEAFMPMKRELFDKARKSKGTDEDIVIIHRKQSNQENFNK